MDFYYGLVDEANNGWGFIEETDPRVKPGMIRLTREEWQQLLNEQSAGREIVCYNGEVFTAEHGWYYVDAQGWHKKSQQEFDDERAAERKQNFESQFFEIPNFGWFRRTPKGYASAIEAVNTAFNAVAVMGSLPAESLIFYTKPDYYSEEQCSEEWLISHQIKSPAMTAQEFGAFYAAFIQAWNTREH